MNIKFFNNNFLLQFVGMNYQKISVLKVFISSLLIFVFITLSTQQLFSQYRVRTVVLDAGHGGKDPGALGKKSKEKQLTLAITLKVGEYIKKYIKGVKVVYTRKTDKFIELYKRAEIANKNNADVFISIHVNSSKSVRPYGTSSFVMGISKSKENLEVAKNENSVILKEANYKKNYKGYDPNSDESHIILSLLQNAHLEQSLSLASKVQKQFKTKASRKDRGVKQEAFIVLWNTTMPAILIETGFITNPSEEKYLMSDYGQSIIASAIYRAFKEYKKEIERNSKYVGTSRKHNNNNNYVKHTNSKHGIIFRVQIKSSIAKIKGNIAGFKNVKEYNFKGIYKYFVGESDSFKEIIRIQDKVREKVPDAFVVAFKKDKRISIKQALNEIRGG